MIIIAGKYWNTYSFDIFTERPSSNWAINFDFNPHFKGQLSSTTKVETYHEGFDFTIYALDLGSTIFLGMISGLVRGCGVNPCVIRGREDALCSGHLLRNILFFWKLQIFCRPSGDADGWWSLGSGLQTLTNSQERS